MQRRDVLTGAGALAGLAAAGLARASGASVDLRLPGGVSHRPLARRFVDKRDMILQRVRPPLLETPLDVFDEGVLTPNDRFFVRWHWSDIPQSVDAGAFRLRLDGRVERPMSLSLDDILRLPRQEVVAVNQCSGNSRGFFQPRVPGGQWGHGAMGAARWTGVSLRHLLDLAGVRADARQVRFSGLDQPPVPDGPTFAKSLDLDRARDGDVMVAFLMNEEPLPLLNGFPLRLVVPGWYSTYWVKMLDRIEVLDHVDDGFWMAKAYRIPDTPFANVSPDAKGYPTRPIGAMPPRSWITNIADGAQVAARAPLPVRGVAMGGDAGVARVDVSFDGGASWRPADLGPDDGRYGFRRFQALAPPSPAGPRVLMARCANAAGAVQPMQANWNPGGYMRSCIEPVRVTAA